ncbi:hypothetical protein NFI96_020901, partial [Prochilodus magdalenae]
TQRTGDVATPQNRGPSGMPHADRGQPKKSSRTQGNPRATFQRLMNTVLAGLVYKCCAVYLDDVVIALPTFDQHLLDLMEVYTRLESAGLSLKLGKCQFCLDELKFLGYRVTPKGILPDLDKVKAVTSFPVPTDVKQSDQGPTDLLPEHAVIAGLDLRAQPVVELTYKEHYGVFNMMTLPWTAPHESTGFSPAKMLYGRELATPVIQPSTDGMHDPFLSPPQSLERSLEETYDHARAALKSSHKRQKHFYDLKRRPVTYQLGDLVHL